MVINLYICEEIFKQVEKLLKSKEKGDDVCLKSKELAVISKLTSWGPRPYLTITGDIDSNPHG